MLALLDILISLADVEALNQSSRDSCSREPIFRRWGIDQPLLPTPSKPPPPPAGFGLNAEPVDQEEGRQVV
ncbi:MAG: hypothetical protein ACOYOF_10940 [Verrucomicrobiaceae bacterium]